jgi:hypothetical protein
MYDFSCQYFTCSLYNVTRLCIDCAEQVQVKWAQRKINRAANRAKHRASLLAATKQQLEKEFSFPLARGASPVIGDDAVAEQDSTECLEHQHTPESRVIHNTLDGKKRRLLTAQDYPWKFVSPQL